MNPSGFSVFCVSCWTCEKEGSVDLVLVPFVWETWVQVAAATEVALEKGCWKEPKDGLWNFLNFFFSGGLVNSLVSLEDLIACVWSSLI